MSWWKKGLLAVGLTLGLAAMTDAQVSRYIFRGPMAIYQTWGNVATTFTAFLINVTDTASASGSKLLDLQVGGASMFRVGKAGSLDIGNSTNLGGSSISIPNSSGYGWSGQAYLRSMATGNVRALNWAGTNTFDITLDDAKTTLSAEGVSVANDAVLYLGTASRGYLMVDNETFFARYVLRGVTNATVEESDVGAIFTTTKDSASSINIYYDAAGASGAGYYLQNKRGSSQTVRLVLIGG